MNCRPDHLARCAQADALFKEGLSERQIALRTGLSRGTLHRIALGEPTYAGPGRPARGATTSARGRHPYPPLAYQAGPVKRCSTCRGRYYGDKCYLCYVRSL